MVSRGDSAHFWPLLVIVATVAMPWLVGIVRAWRWLPRDDYLPPSLAERARRRLWQ